MVLAHDEDLLLTADEELKQNASQEGISAMLSRDVVYNVRGI